MVRKSVIALADSQVRGGKTAPDFQRRNPRRIRLQSEHDQVVDRREITRESLVLGDVQIDLRLRDFLPVPVQIKLGFDIANGRKIFVQLGAV